MEIKNSGPKKEKANTGKKFREMDLDEKLDFLRNRGASDDAIATYRKGQMREFANNNEGSLGLPTKAPNGENQFSWFFMSQGLVTQITVNGKDRMVPVVVEEPSVISAASNAAKWVIGGFTSRPLHPDDATCTVGQVQIVGVPQERIEQKIEEVRNNFETLKKIADKTSETLRKEGRGFKYVEPKRISTTVGEMIIIDFLADCAEAMGANQVSKMAEAIADKLAQITGGRYIGRILSNMAVERTIECMAVFDKSKLALEKTITDVHGNEKRLSFSGDEMVEKIVALAAWAEEDQRRATTHNKGIMNGISSVALALGQDTRAIEAAAHSYAAKNGRYMPLSYFDTDDGGNLIATLEVPIPIGTVGTAITKNEMASANLGIMQCRSSLEVAEVMAAVGLAQNVSAMRMLAGEGIVGGHIPSDKRMKEQKRN
ncbi:MAG: hypothetical protein KGH61_01040 [Candidatus Micrarchaeota archaeon]|nr:hypothetical protein [Candidatus Micrarchaeota archaeon]MDE1847519.1 hypothetical protein [Candidatus Micrarchaeota archaeon]MDE1863845.1 hypothetical protein [Candidatus Micrarchaeota archaeon]